MGLEGGLAGGVVGLGKGLATCQAGGAVNGISGWLGGCGELGGHVLRKVEI